MADRIEKQVDINAPVERVWRALTDYQEFGAWFRVALETPFVVGQTVSGHSTYPGYEHMKWDAVIQAMEPENLFALTWHPAAIDPDKDYSGEPQTLVEFRLEKMESGTRLTVTESGFDRLPDDRREAAYKMDDMGWAQQMKNIEKHVTENP